MIINADKIPVSRIEFVAYLNRVCTGQSSDSERPRDQLQSAAVTLQVSLSFSFVSRASKHLIECIARELIVSRPILSQP